MQPGDTVTYTLTVTNTSDAVVNTTVTDDLSDVLDNATIELHRPDRRPPDRHHLDLDHPTLQPDVTTTLLHRHRRRRRLQRDPRQRRHPRTRRRMLDRLRHRTPDPGLHADQDLRPGRRTTVEPGDTVTYTLTVTNASDGVVTATFTDDLSDVLDDATYRRHAPAAS